MFTKLATVSLVAATSLLVHATPIARNNDKASSSGITDDVILNYALTLEHLENAFYSGALEKFNASAFNSSGFPDSVRERFTQISEHEATHVSALSAALGSKAVKPCNYSFPYTDPKSFAAVSQILEGVGTAAYTGAASSIKNKDYVTVAASILATEARHATYVASTVNGQEPWSTAFETPLNFNETYTLAAGFITGCPSSNVALPFAPFPALTFPSNTTQNSTVTLSFNSTTSSKTQLYAVFLTGLDQIVVPVHSNKSVEVPGNLNGTVYALVIKSKTTPVTDSNTVAGPAILQFPF